MEQTSTPTAVGSNAELGPLPSPTLLCTFMPDDYRYGNVYGFTAKQMKSYAARAVAAERENIAQWLEGQGQPGYAHEVRFRA